MSCVKISALPTTAQDWKISRRNLDSRMKMKNVHTPFVLKIRTNVQNNVNNVQIVNKNIYYI